MSTPDWSTTLARVRWSPSPGIIRDHDRERSVKGLEYSGHPAAGAVVLKWLGTSRAMREAFARFAVSHRIGRLGIGDVALAFTVAGDHQNAAGAAWSELVDEIKRLLSVWKHQTFADGTDE
jgi:molybdopterin synthase catalytic subunit